MTSVSPLGSTLTVIRFSKLCRSCADAADTASNNTKSKKTAGKPENNLCRIQPPCSMRAKRHWLALFQAIAHRRGRQTRAGDRPMERAPGERGEIGGRYNRTH